MIFKTSPTVGYSADNNESKVRKKVYIFFKKNPPKKIWSKFGEERTTGRLGSYLGSNS